MGRWWEPVLDPSERQIDSLADTLRGLRDFVLPKLLHGSGHDEERTVAHRE